MDQPDPAAPPDLAAARRAAEARARGARTDLREVRPGLVRAARSLVARSRGGAREASGPSAAVPGRARDRDARARVRQAGRNDVRGFRSHAARGRVDRAGAYGEAARRHRCRGQGAAAERRGADRARSRGAVRDRGARGGVLGGGAAAAPGRGRRGIREDPVQRARHDARGRERFAAQAQLRGLGSALCSGNLLGLLPAEHLHHGADRRHPRRRHRGAAGRGHGHPPARGERRRDLFHAGVPAQLLPRRHAPGQHLRAT